MQKLPKELEEALRDGHVAINGTLSLGCSKDGRILHKQGDEADLLYPNHYEFNFGDAARIRILLNSLSNALLPRLFQQGNLKLAVTLRGGYLFGVYVNDDRSPIDAYADFEAWDKRLANASEG